MLDAQDVIFYAVRRKKSLINNIEKEKKTMKRRIISSILVVVMLVLSLVSCGYSYTKDDMTQYMTFDKEAFDAALESLEYEDGAFTTNEETRAAKIEKYIYKLLVGRLASDAEKLKEGAISTSDKLYYRYYVTYVSNGETVYVYPSKMGATSASDNVALGDNELTGKDKAIRDRVVELIGNGTLAEIKNYIYTPTTSGDATVTVAGVTAYISYTKTWTDAAGATQTQSYTYERVTLGDEANYASTQLIGATIGTTIANKVTADGTEYDRKNTEGGIEYTYTSLKVNCVVPAVAEGSTDPNSEILVTYTTPDKLPLAQSDFVTKRDSYEIPAETELTYHVNPAYYNDVEENSAELILKELLAKLPSKSVEGEDGKTTSEARELECLKDAEEELSEFKKALSAYNTAKSAHDTAVTAVSDAETALESVKKTNDAESDAVKTAENALKGKQGEAETKLAEKNAAETTMNEKLAALYAKINADEATAKATIMDEFKALVKDVLIDEYNAEVKANIAKAVWNAMLANANVTSYPKKAVEETYDRMFEMLQAEFYTGKDGSVTHYSKHNGEFDAFLIQEMKKHEKLPTDIKSSVTDDTQAKHALWWLAQDYVADIVVVYYVAELYDLTYDKSEIKDFKKGDDGFFEYYETYHGESNVLAAHQLDGVLDHFLELERGEDGKVIYSETDGTPTYSNITIKKKA